MNNYLSQGNFREDRFPSFQIAVSEKGKRTVADKGASRSNKDYDKCEQLDTLACLRNETSCYRGKERGMDFTP